MTIELTSAEKIEIVNQHLKNLSYAKYNATLSLKEANAAASPNQSTVQALTDSINDADNQIAVLNTELNSLQSSTN